MRFFSRKAGVSRSAWKQPFAIVGAVIIAFWVLMAAIAPLVGDPLALIGPTLQGPSSEHPLGTDQIGRDVLTRVVWGSRYSILPAVVLVSIALVIGITVGAVAAYFGGLIDEVIMRITDLTFAFPTFILAMAVVSMLGPNIQNAVIALAMVRWPDIARVVRGVVLSIRDSDFVNANRLLGSSSAEAIRVDVLPNVGGPVAVLSALDMGSAILVLAGLSFLGLGNRPPTPDWGAMVGDGARYYASWWVVTFPGVAILSIVVAFNFIADAMRDALDPRAARAAKTDTSVAA